jgi:hypothetical protein
MALREYGLTTIVASHTDLSLHSLCFSLGKPQTTSPAQFWDTEYIDGKDYPIAIFVFKYRSEGEAIPSFLIITR